MSEAEERPEGPAPVEPAHPAPAASAPARVPASGRAWAILGAVAVVAVALDQVTKALVRRSLELGERHPLLAGIDLTRTGNEGISFGIGGGRQELLIALSIAAVVAMLVHVARSGGRGTLYPLAFGLLVGGAVGNLIDRVAHGSVTDFVALPRFWIFNVADVCITAGVVVLGLVFLRPQHAPARPLAQRLPDPAED